MWCGPTRGELLPTPSVEARPHQHCDQSAAEDSKCLSQRVWFPWRASRARITPLSSGRRRAEYASRSVDLAWLLWANSRRALSPRRRTRRNRINTATGRKHDVRDFFSTAFGPRGAQPTRTSPCGESTDRLRGTRRAARTWNCCDVGQRGRAPPHAASRGLSAPTPRQVGGGGLRKTLVARSYPVARVPRAYRAMEKRSTGLGARAVQRGLGVVVLWANARRAPSHTAGRGSTAPTPRQVGGTASKVLVRAFESRGARRARFRTME